MKVFVTGKMKKMLFVVIARMIRKKTDKKKKMVPISRVHLFFQVKHGWSKHQTYAVVNSLQESGILKKFHNHNNGVLYVGITLKGWEILENAEEKKEGSRS